MKHLFRSAGIEEELENLTLEEQMKLELLFEAYNKFSLTELEEKLGGNRFTF
jgi:hypothetical protein